MGSASGRKIKLKTGLFCGIQRKQLSYYSLKWSVDKLLMKIIVSQMPTQAVCDFKKSFQRGLQTLRSLEKPLKVLCWIRSSLARMNLRTPLTFGKSIDHGNNALLKKCSHWFYFDFCTVFAAVTVYIEVKQMMSKWSEVERYNMLTDVHVLIFKKHHIWK